MSTRHSRSFTHRSRDRIIAAKIVHRLIKFVNGEIEMTRQQTQVGMKLVDKVLPSLRAVEVSSTEPDIRNPREMSSEDLLISLYRSPNGQEVIQEVLDKWRSEILGRKTV